MLLLLVPVKLTHVSCDQTVLEGSNTTLFCEGTGRPKPNITLTRVLKDGSDGETLPQSLTWNFPNINRNTSGTYRCKAENEYETVSQVFEVIVKCKYVKSLLLRLLHGKCARTVLTHIFLWHQNERVSVANE